MASRGNGGDNDVNSLQQDELWHGLDHTCGKRNVYKFGGSSLGSPKRLFQLIEILTQERDRVVAVVVSAMGDTTDLLVEAAEVAAHGHIHQAMKLVDQIQELAITNAHDTQELLGIRRFDEHSTMEKALPPTFRDFTALIVEFFQPLRELLHGVSLLQERTVAVMDAVLSYGERMSATIVSMLLTLGGVDACFVDARDWLVTDSSFGCARVDFAQSKENLVQLQTKWSDRLPVITGFIGKSQQNGKTTTLGRNGSDYTATLVGASLQADFVVINTDISGVMTADPNLVTRAVTLSHLNHHEALELAVYGSRMFHPRTMVPLIQEKIVMLIRNTMDPNGHGTYISHLQHTGKAETCTTSLENLSLIELRSRFLQQNAMTLTNNYNNFSSFNEDTISTRLTRLLEQDAKIPVWMCIRGAHGQSICVVIPKSKEPLACALIQQEFHQELGQHEIDPIQVKSPVTMLSIVAEQKTCDLPWQHTKFFHALAQAGVKVFAVGQGSSTRSLSCVIDSKDTKLAVRRVHDAFNVDYIDIHVAILGNNPVARQVRERLVQQADFYLTQHRAKFHFVSVKNGSLSALEEFQNRVNNPIVIDCCGLPNDNKREFFGACLQRGIPVVVSNAKSVAYLPPKKISSPSSLCLFSSTIGASLPVVDTLHQIIKTGDEIHEISASLSGSMGFVTHALMDGETFSQAMAKAFEKGFLEPNFEDDLFGVDMGHKVHVLARQLGLSELSLSQIAITPLIPAELYGKYKSKAPHDLLDLSKPAQLEELRNWWQRFDGFFDENYVQPAKAMNQRLRYVATIKFVPTGCSSSTGVDLEATIEPKLVDENHVTFSIQQDEIAIGFFTQQYNPQPLVLKGTGTGANASAIGVLRDVLKLVNVLNGKKL